MSILFSPMKIGNLEIKNRFVHSATYESMATSDGEVSDEMVKRYSNLAKGEIGLIIPGYLYVHHSGKPTGRGAGIYADEMIPGLKRIVHAVHQHGGKIVFQLAHAGRQTTKKITGQVPIGPSSIGRDPTYFVKPREMTEENIREMIQSFGQAARRAVEAGADGIQLQACHGFLINQFLSPFFNRRKDLWGGSEDNRFRFLEKVYWEVKKSVPKETLILIKLNTHDHTPDQGITPELARNYAQRLAEMGIDAIEISSGAALYSFWETCRGQVPAQEMAAGFPSWLRLVAKITLKRLVGKYDLIEGYHLEAAKIIKPVLGQIPLLLVGGMRNASYMEYVLEKGYADFISMSRPFIREPFLVKRMREGKTAQATCVSCNKCLAAAFNQMPVRCYYDMNLGDFRAASRNR